MSRLFGPFAVIAGLLAGVTAFGADQQSAAPGNIVCLTCREPGGVDKSQVPPPLLARELVRQAFLIAARDECGLLTRDATLREEFPASTDPRSAPFDFFSFMQMAKKGLDYGYELKETGKTENKLWDWKYHVDVKDQLTTIKTPQSIATLAEQAEALSRGKFKDLLTGQGWGKSVPAARASSVVPEQAEDELWAWNEITVIGGLRRIHAEIREKGESPELLAAMTVGYANLGMLTECYFSAAPKAYSARALLYAERLLERTDHSSWALWHRAYVRAVVGMHHLAEADIAAAKEKPAKAPKVASLPFWTSVVENFLQGNLPLMLKEASGQPQRRLAKYLNLEAAMWVVNNDLRVKAGQAVMEECPDCFRALDGMCSLRYLGVLATVTEGAFDRMTDSLRQRLPGIPGLPERLAKRIKEHKPSEDRPDEVKSRVQLVADIKEVAKSGADKIEPSLAALGQTIEEIELLQVMRRLELERFVWAVPTEQTISLYRPLFAHHRYAGFVDLFSTSTLEALAGAAALIPRMETSELTHIHGGPFRMGQSYVHLVQNYGRQQLNHWLAVVYAHGDPVLRDELLGIDDGAASTPKDKRFNDPYMKMLAETSSKFPAAVAAQISRNWKDTKPQAAQIEKQFADDPVVLDALTSKYLELKQYDDAERGGKRKIEIAPDFASYHRLAAIYKAKKDIDRWRETLEKSLQSPAYALEGFHVRNTLARYYMDRKEWRQALPFAEGAAESYASWGLEAAARCHEMLGNWKKSEELMKAISERYENYAFDWMLWCHRTGHGNERDAAELAKRYFESLGTGAVPIQLELIGVYYLFEREPEKAMQVFEKTYQRSKNVYHALHAAIIADTLGNAAHRDANLDHVILSGLRVRPNAPTGFYARVAKLMKTALPLGSIKDFDFKELDAVLEEARKGTQQTDTNLKYFIGVFLKNRGDAEKSRYYLVRSAQTAQYFRPNQALACELLREMKVPYEPLGDEKIEVEKAADP